MKVKFDLESGEAYVIASVEFWDHLVNTFVSLAQESDNSEGWYDCARHIREWTDATAFFGDQEEELGA